MLSGKKLNNEIINLYAILKKYSLKNKMGKRFDPGDDFI